MDTVYNAANSSVGNHVPKSRRHVVSQDHEQRKKPIADPRNAEFCIPPAYNSRSRSTDPDSMTHDTISPTSSNRIAHNDRVTVSRVIGIPTALSISNNHSSARGKTTRQQNNRAGDDGDDNAKDRDEIQLVPNGDATSGGGKGADAAAAAAAKQKKKRLLRRPRRNSTIDKIIRILQDERISDKGNLYQLQDLQLPLLRKVLNIIFVTLGVAFLLAVIVIIIYTTVVSDKHEEPPELAAANKKHG